MEMADTIRLWELGLMQDEVKVRMERLEDVSPNGAFGRCLVYRLDVSNLSSKDMARLCKELHAFRLSRYESQARLMRRPVRVHKIASSTRLNGWETTRRAHALYRDLPYEVKFLIEVGV